MRHVHATHDAAIVAAKATTTKHTTTQPAAIDMTMPFSPKGETQSASPEPTPQPAAVVTQQTESAIITPPSCFRISFSKISSQSCSITEWMKLSDPTRKTYYVNASTHQVQRDAPTTGEVEHIA